MYVPLIVGAVARSFGSEERAESPLESNSRRAFATSASCTSVTRSNSCSAFLRFVYAMDRVASSAPEMSLSYEAMAPLSTARASLRCATSCADACVARISPCVTIAPSYAYTSVTTPTEGKASSAVFFAST